MAIDVGMWIRAMTTIPRVEKPQWDGLDPFARWLVATRAAVLIMTFIAAAIAGILAGKDGRFDPVLFAVDAAGLLLAHATNNLVNDLTDSWTGVDKGDYVRKKYGTQPVEQGLMTVRQAIGYAAVTGAAAIACGVYLAWVRGPAVLLLMGIGAVFVLFYTWPLKHIGLGEPAVVAVWGPLMTGGSYFVIAGTWSTTAVVASLPFALAATAVLFGKHIDKLDADRKKKVRTLPVILGHRLSRATVIAMVIAMYAICGWLVARRALGVSIVFLLLAAKPAWMLVRAYAAPVPAERPAEFPAEVWPLWYSAYSFHHTRRFGIGYVLALAVDLALHRLG